MATKCNKIGVLEDGTGIFHNPATNEYLKMNSHGELMPATEKEVKTASGFTTPLSSEKTALLPVEIVKPIVTPEQAGQLMKDYQSLLRNILEPNDYANIKGVKFRKRSGWRKIARFFGLSWVIISEEWANGSVKFIVKVSAPNGRHVFSDGACDKEDFMEGMKPSLHNVRSKGLTRAVNRGIADLVGGGEVSAEEVQ